MSTSPHQFERCLFVVSAPSGAGKTSLVRAALDADPGLQAAVSHTTRQRRPGEIDGENYHFVDDALFRRMIDEDAFLEHAEVFGHLYGTSASAVATTQASGVDVVLEIDWQGARQIRSRYPETVSVFVLPPSRTELRRRLTTRGQDAADVINRRTEQAVTEMREYHAFDYLIVNDDFDRALADLLAVVQASRLRLAQQRVRLKPLIDDLLAD